MGAGNIITGPIHQNKPESSVPNDLEDSMKILSSQGNKRSKTNHIPSTRTSSEEDEKSGTEIIQQLLDAIERPPLASEKEVTVSADRTESEAENVDDGERSEQVRSRTKREENRKRPVNNTSYCVGNLKKDVTTIQSKY